jgi:hypothetical protein
VSEDDDNGGYADNDDMSNNNNNDGREIREVTNLTILSSSRSKNNIIGKAKDCRRVVQIKNNL